MPVFFDSNILLYLARDDARKAEIAEKLLLGGGMISVQVLNEITLTARRKFGYDWVRVAHLIDDVQVFLTVTDLTLAIHDRGRLLAERYGFRVYDAMIVAAALATGCDTLYSEDMHAGLVIDARLTIVNPFK